MRTHSYNTPFQKKYKTKYKTRMSYKNLQAISNYVKRRIPFRVLIVLVIFAGGTASLAMGAPQVLYNKFSALMKLATLEFTEVGSSNVSHILPTNFLRKTAAIKHGEELLKIDLDQLEKRLSSIPWISAVRIKKRLPSTLTVEYETENVRAIVMRGRIPWVVSVGGKVLAPLSELSDFTNDSISAQESSQSIGTDTVSGVQKQAAAYDLPVLITARKEDVGVLLEWLDKLEHDVGSNLITVHQLESTKWGGVRSLVDIKASNGSSKKVTIIGWSSLSATTTKRLAKVLNAVQEKNLNPYAIDLRPNKKIIVSQAEGS